MALEFDPDTHIYRYDGVVQPSVTTVLAVGGFLETRWFTEEDRERGRDAHFACRLRDEGELDPASIAPSIAREQSARRGGDGRRGVAAGGRGW